MNYSKIKAIIKRELKEKLFSKTFIIMTLLIPIIFIVSIGIQVYFASYEEDTQKQIIIVSEAPELQPLLKEKFASEDFVREGNYVFDYETLSENEFERELKKLKPLLLDETLTGVVFIPDSALKNKKIYYYSKTPGNKIILLRLKKAINDVLIFKYFSDKGFNAEDIRYAKKSVTVTEMQVSSKRISEKNKGEEVLGFLFIFLLYMSLIFSGQLILRSVIEEKQNRIVELLLSSVESNELMSGKIIGAAITSLAQMLIWIAPLIVAVSTSWIAMPENFAISIPIWKWIYFIFNFIIGLVIFLGLFAATGAIFDNEQDAQSGLWPLMLLIMIPLFIAVSIAQNPSTSLARITSFVPFASLFVMPERISFSEVPALEITLSIVINLVTLIIIIPVAGKIYKTGILMTGKKPSWSEIAKWLKN